MRAKLFSFLQYLVGSFGYFGVFTVAILEGIFLPIPVDPFLFFAAALGMNVHFLVWVVIAGSLLGGCLSYLGGYYLGKPVFYRLFGKKAFKKGEEYICRYGAFGVFLAALTPIPYNITCWIVGIFRMNFATFFFSALLGRTPRILLVAYAGYFVGRIPWGSILGRFF